KKKFGFASLMKKPTIPTVDMGSSKVKREGSSKGSVKREGAKPSVKREGSKPAPSVKRESGAK
ncbi:hypothetical protein KIPB_014769, partial [Kipferlia bialata]